MIIYTNYDQIVITGRDNPKRRISWGNGKQSLQTNEITWIVLDSALNFWQTTNLKDIEIAVSIFVRFGETKCNLNYQSTGHASKNVV